MELGEGEKKKKGEKKKGKKKNKKGSRIGEVKEVGGGEREGGGGERGGEDVEEEDGPLDAPEAVVLLLGELMKETRDVPYLFRFLEDDYGVENLKNAIEVLIEIERETKIQL